MYSTTYRRKPDTINSNIRRHRSLESLLDSDKEKIASDIENDVMSIIKTILLDCAALKPDDPITFVANALKR